MGSRHDLEKRYLSLKATNPDKVISSRRVTSSLDYTSERGAKKVVEPKSAILDNIQLLNRV